MTSVGTAFAWGGLSSAALYLGQALAGPMSRAHRSTGLVMGFGAGTLLSAVAYELVPEANVSHSGVSAAVGFLLGAVSYYVADKIVDRRGGQDRQRIAGPTVGRGSVASGRSAGAGSVAGAGSAGGVGSAGGGSAAGGAAMFLGALLDGIPEAFILGISLALGGGISLAFVAAVFISNIPQGVAGTTSLKAAGYTGRHVFWMWTALTVASALVAGTGYLVADAIPDQGLFAQAFAAGAVLTMLADSMMPEAFRHGGTTVGLLTVLGYLTAAALAVAE